MTRCRHQGADQGRARARARASSCAKCAARISCPSSTISLPPSLNHRHLFRRPRISWPQATRASITHTLFNAIAKNSRCEFSTMHRNRVATGTRQQDLSPCSLSSPLQLPVTTRSFLWPRPSSLLLAVDVRRFLVNERRGGPARSRLFFGTFRDVAVTF